MCIYSNVFVYIITNGSGVGVEPSSFVAWAGFGRISTPSKVYLRFSNKAS